MAFSSTTTQIKRFGRNMVMSYGTFTNTSGDSGGDIDTGLAVCNYFVPTCSSHLGTETIKTTISGGTVTLVTSTDCDGYWLAIGY